MRKKGSKYKKTQNSKQTNKRQKRFGNKLILLTCFVLAAFAVLTVSGVFPFFKGSKAIAASPEKNPATTVTAEDGGQISPEAMRQIEALEQEKESRTPAQQKIDSRLLYQIKMSRNEAIASGVQTLDTDLKVDESGFIAVDLTANVNAKLMEKLKEINAVMIASLPQYRSVTARIPIGEIESLAGMDEIIFVQPKLDGTTNKIERSPEMSLLDTTNNASPLIIKTKTSANFANRAENVREYLKSVLSGNLIPTIGSVTSQGDTTHRANIARLLTNTNGTGIKIGVLSDGVNSLAAGQASGDLPATVNVLTGQAGTGDEGTAMLQLIYDTAPGAQLYFATANTSLTSFAQNIKDLRTAGCDIIVDDFSYFVETPFQNGQSPSVVAPTNGGLLIQSVNDVTVGSQAGALYFSSAANSGNKNDNTAGAWEGDFVDGGDTTAPIPTGNKVHSFGASTFDSLTVGGRTFLKWSDPLGASSNDYDLYVLDSTGTTVAASSTNIQSGTQDPVEDAGTRVTGQRIVIVKKAAAAVRFLHLNTNRGVLAISTSGVVYGHNAGLNTISTAATPAGPAVFSPLALGPFPNAHSTANVVETFSSDGPRRIFYNADSTAITPGNVSSTGGQLLQKPDLTAADGTSTTAPGFNPFFGTSAAAPQAGAIAAVLKSASPTSTNAQILNALTSSALDIEAPGVDRDSGAGIIMPLRALAALGVTAPAYLDNGANTITEATGNGNGSIEPGETANLTIPLSNIGLTNATAISATLTTSTAGVTITQGTQAYPNLTAVSGTATNATPFKFTLANNFACGAAVSFTLTVNYTGGVAASQIYNFTVNTGKPAVIATTLDTTPPPSGVGYSAVTGTQTGRLVRNGVVSSCGTAKVAPGLNDSTVGRRFDAYTFTASTTGCITITLNSTGTTLYTAAYNSSGYVATNPNANFLGDPGTSSPTSSYSFDVMAGQQFTVVVHEITVGVGGNYTLNVSGVIAGVCNVSAAIKSRSDFDGDGRTDLSVYRPSEGNWYLNRSTGGFGVIRWGLSTDTLTPGDFDGDGKADTAIFRPDANSANPDFFILNSNGFTVSGISWGIAGDIPVIGDFDGDGKSNVAVWRPSNGNWYILRNDGTAQVTQFGSNGDVPMSIDTDSDGKTELAVFRPSNNNWYIWQSTTNAVIAVNWGLSGDKLVPADYDGDNKDDVAVFRPSEGKWYVRNSSNGAAVVTAWGSSSDVPVPGDYDGDGKDDLAVYRNGTWYINRSTAGQLITDFGTATDTAIPAKYIP
jgi:Subtilase family/FG-GAP-like repeat